MSKMQHDKRLGGGSHRSRTRLSKACRVLAAPLVSCLLMGLCLLAHAHALGVRDRHDITITSLSPVASSPVSSPSSSKATDEPAPRLSATFKTDALSDHKTSSDPLEEQKDLGPVLEFKLGHCTPADRAYFSQTNNELVVFFHYCHDYIETQQKDYCDASCKNSVGKLQDLLVRSPNLRTCIAEDTAVSKLLDFFADGTCGGSGEPFSSVTVPQIDSSVINHDINPPKNTNSSKKNSSLDQTTRNGLSQLWPSAGELEPQFQPKRVNYRVYVPLSVSSAHITPEYGEGFIVVVDGELVQSGSPSRKRALAIGDTVFQVVETGLQNEENPLSETRIYTVTFRRSEAPPQDAVLPDTISDTLALPPRGKDGPLTAEQIKKCQVFLNLIKENCSAVLEQTKSIDDILHQLYLFKACPRNCQVTLIKIKNIASSNYGAERCIELKEYSEVFLQLAQTPCDFEKLELVDEHNYDIPGINVIGDSNRGPTSHRKRNGDSRDPDSVASSRYGEPVVEVNVNVSSNSSKVVDDTHGGIIVGASDVPAPVDGSVHCRDNAQLVSDQDGRPYCKDVTPPLPLSTDGQPIYSTPVTSKPRNSADQQAPRSNSSPSQTASDSEQGGESHEKDYLSFYISPDDWEKFQTLFSHKLLTLEQAGFTNRNKNLRLLIWHHGDINAVIEILDGTPRKATFYEDDDEDEVPENEPKSEESSDVTPPHPDESGKRNNSTDNKSHTEHANSTENNRSNKSKAPSDSVVEILEEGFN